MSNRSSFTLIELLVVIAILAILSVAVVLIINPADIIRQSRDTTRLTDLNNLNKALGVFDVTNPNDFTGTSTIIYTSLPDSSSVCANLSLPALPAGYSYNCATSSTLTKIDGTGWVPINFATTSYGSTLNRLPIDPVNSSTTGQYYTYTPGGSWELNTVLESNKYRTNNTLTKPNLPGVLSIGTDKTLNPVYTATGLIAYYQFNEQTGTTLNDTVGGYTGTITAGTGSWTTDNKGNARAYDFDGANTTIPTTLTSNTDFQNGFTISAWINPDSGGESGTTNCGRIVDKSESTTSTNGFALRLRCSAQTIYFIINGNEDVVGSYSIGAWQHILVTITSGGSILTYQNGILGSTDVNSPLSQVTTSNPLTIGNRSTAQDKTFNGRISDVRIYNRVLSAAEVQAIYNSTR